MDAPPQPLRGARVEGGGGRGPPSYAPGLVDLLEADFMSLGSTLLW